MQYQGGGRRRRRRFEHGGGITAVSVADPVKAVTGVKDQEISLPLSPTHTLTHSLNTPADLPLVADEVS